MSFSELQQRVASDAAIQAAHANLAKLELFSHTFTELDGRPGESISVPVYDLSAGSEFVAGTNDYGSGANEIGGLVVTLDKHFVKPVSITDTQLAFTGINWVKDTSFALADRITRDINAEVFGALDDEEITLSASISTYIGATPAKTAVAGLYALAEENDIPVDRCVVVLSPTYFSKVLGLVDYSMIGEGDYIKTGVIKNLFGFKGIVCSTNLPEGIEGAIMLDESLGVASKYLAPGTPDAYPEAWKATDDNGFTIGFRRFMDLNTGNNKFAVDTLFGYKVLQPNKIVTLK